MAIELEIYAAHSDDIIGCLNHLHGLPDVVVDPRSGPVRVGEQNAGLWEFLTVTCGTGGAATVAVQALRGWIESKTTTLTIKVGSTEISLRTDNAAVAIPQLIELIERAQP